MQPALCSPEHLNRLGAEPDLLFELAIHGLLGGFVAVHSPLGKLPRVPAIDSATPQHLIHFIANHDAHVWPETIPVYNTFVVW